MRAPPGPLPRPPPAGGMTPSSPRPCPVPSSPLPSRSATRSCGRCRTYSPSAWPGQAAR